MSATLRILAAGPGVTIQDRGRNGYLRFGASEAGAMDRLAYRIANRAVGSPMDSPALEVSNGGVEVSVEGAPVSIGVAGGAFNVALDGRPMPTACVVPLEPGMRLSVRAGSAGSWCYLAPAARIDVAPMLGSIATHTRTALGGLGGRPLATGDALPLFEPHIILGGAAEIVAPSAHRDGGPIRVILGPQDDFFAPDQIDAFLRGPWTVSARSDRMAYMLDGPKLTHAKGFNIVSDGIAMGAIQVPGAGQPVVLMADRQPTGGYPKIANVIGVDLGRLAQMRPGDMLQFTAVTVEEAVAARRQEARLVAEPVTLAPLVRTDLSSEFLLGLNLVDGVTAA
ncbi:MAG: biotin-dependent carboxyltransferase family protein [Variibacter sp.]